MKVSRIFPYIKTKGERRHEGLVKAASVAQFTHPGSKNNKILSLISKRKLTSSRFNILNKMLGLR